LMLLEGVARTGEPILVTKRGKPLARVTSSGASDASCPQDTLLGTVEIIGDLIEPVFPPAAWNAVRGVLLTQEDDGRVPASAKGSQRRSTRRRAARKRSRP